MEEGGRKRSKEEKRKIGDAKMFEGTMVVEM